MMGLGVSFSYIIFSCTTIYSPYSVRSASTSAAKAKGIPIDQILTAGGWSSFSTFAKYYNKPIKQSNGDYSTSLLKPS